jgi:CheY-like chemotaxis protein
MTKILLVEDDKSLREIYGVRLLAEGYDIVSAGDGEEALAMAIKERPQLIVADVMMPKISGFDMLDILRSTTETKDIKVIMMTALSSEDQRARGEALGADRYLVKSQVGIEDVVRTVHEVLGDAPVAAQANQFAPTARPSQPAVPPRPSTPAPTPQPEAPQQRSVAPPASRPVVQPTAPQNQSGLPQPTAPFSSGARPANLGERVIHPITPQDTTTPDISSLMDQELNQGAPPPPQAPPVAQPSVPTPSAPSDQDSPVPQAPESPTTPVPAPPPLLAAPQDSGIAFEETPRPAPAAGGAQPNPFGPQPPAQQ